MRYFTNRAEKRAAGQRLAPVALTTLLVGLLAACGGGSTPAPPPAAVSTACEAATGASTVVVGSGLPGDPALPEPSSGFRLGIQPVLAKNYMVVTANPLATKAGCDVLRAGGTAADAAVAVQMVLGLVEPQSSGIGGGAFVVHYDAATKTVQTYDGRETAASCGHRKLPALGQRHRPDHAPAREQQRFQFNAPQRTLHRHTRHGAGAGNAARRPRHPNLGQPI